MSCFYISSISGQSLCKRKRINCRGVMCNKFRDSDRTNGVELMIGENSLRLQAWGKI